MNTMRARVRRLGLGVLALVLLATGSCIKLRNATLILPDGSGRIVLSASIRATKPGGLVSGGVEGWVDRVFSSSHGVAAVTDVHASQDGEWNAMSCVLWFEDANSFQLFGHGPTETARLELHWRPDGAGFVLESSGGGILWFAGEQLKSLDKLDAAPPDMQKMAQAMHESTLKMLEGFEMVSEVRLPGVVAAVEGFRKVDDHTVSASLVHADLNDAAKLREITKIPVFRARCGPSTMTQAEIGAFKADLARAKLEWSRSPAMQLVAATVGKPIAEGVRDFWIVGDGTRVLVTDTDGHCRLVDGSGAPLADLRFDEKPDDAFVTADGRYLVAAEPERTEVHDLPANKRVWAVPLSAPKDWFPHRALLRQGAIVVAHPDGPIELLDVATGRSLRSLSGDWHVRSIAAVPGSSNFAVIDGRSLALVDAEKGNRVWTLEPSFKSLRAAYTALATGASGGPIVAVAIDENHSVVEVIDAATGKRLATLDGLKAPIAVARSGKLGIAQSVGATAVVVIELPSGRVIGRLQAPDLANGKFEFGADDASAYVRPFLDEKGRILPVRLELPKPAGPTPPSGK